MRTFQRVTFVALTVLLMLSCQPRVVNEVVFKSHRLDFGINVENHEATFSDSGQIQVFKGVNLLYIAPDAHISKLSIGKVSPNLMLLDSTRLSEQDSELIAKIEALDPPKDALWVLFEYNRAEITDFSLKYAATFSADVEDVKFSNQNVGREVTATILDKGAYFSPGAFYYPQGKDGLMSFEVTATIPSAWETIADGNSVASVTSGATKIQSWKNPYQSDGLMFMAAPFHVKHARAGDVDVYCYFFEEDTSLFETYLPATVDYVNMYSELIGAYPYKRFTVAENFFPTGYGMPAWTLLGQQVIRLPFIVMTSLGHEVLHNWWGNSIYVDYKNGNWCEGLTVYGADYRYKLKRGPDGARDYRKDVLKQYKSYVTKENEFPVREFEARHNAESRTIGYNKTMMIFHMVEEIIGEEAFFQAWRNVFAENIGQQVSWEKWIQAYEKASGKDLSYIIPQWVDRVGAAHIQVELLESEFTNNQTRIKFKVSQTGDDLYNLQIPVKFIGVDGQDGQVGITGAEAIFEFKVNGQASAFELDPDYNLFRHLYPQEIEATVAAAMGASEKHFWYYKEGDREALKLFGDALTEGDIYPASVNDAVSVGLEGNYAIFALNPTQLPRELSKQIQMDKTSITINGESFPRAGHSFILSSEEEEIAAKTMIVVSDDLASLPRIGQLVPHYGKYSYLVFKGTRNVAKGQWPALTSPLRVAL
jgi:aminopeptidase N